MVNVYNWSDYIAEDTLANFAATTGIQGNYDVYDSNDTLEARMLAGSSGFDVAVPTGNYLQRQIAAGVYQPLNRDLLPNWGNMDPQLMALAEAFDAGNEHAVIYMWGTTGIGYNIDAIRERLGADYVVNSWSLIFDPEIAARLADCGISWLDDHTELLPARAAVYRQGPAQHRRGRSGSRGRDAGAGAPDGALFPFVAVYFGPRQR